MKRIASFITILTLSVSVFSFVGVPTAKADSAINPNKLTSRFSRRTRSMRPSRRSITRRYNSSVRSTADYRQHLINLQQERTRKAVEAKEQQDANLDAEIERKSMENAPLSRTRHRRRSDRRRLSGELNPDNTCIRIRGRCLNTY